MVVKEEGREGEALKMVLGRSKPPNTPVNPSGVSLSFSRIFDYIEFENGIIDIALSNINQDLKIPSTLRSIFKLPDF